MGVYGKTDLSEALLLLDLLRQNFPNVTFLGETPSESIFMRAMETKDEAEVERIRATGARAIQINTGKGCHLDAHMVGHALERLAPADNSLVMIENVGNLVCPAAYDLGEDLRVVLLGVGEGEEHARLVPDAAVRELPQLRAE